jgi:hypothetical protein
VRIPDPIKNCVAFIHYRRAMADPPRTGGTAFFVGMVGQGPSNAPIYAVTARHVIEGCYQNSQDGKILIRANIRGSGTEFIETNSTDWIYHPTDETVDVAVLAISCDAKDMRQRNILNSLDIQLFGPLPGGAAVPEIISAEDIGAGDEVFITGLFSNHPGRLKNIPIVRVGNIAAMPEERVQTTWHNREIEAYLIEARSVGGVSGSPVFVHLGPVNTKGTNRIRKTRMRGGRCYLFGLIHGHFNQRLADTDVDAADAGNQRDINCGIAIVVPAYKILEVLGHPALVEQRRLIAEEEARLMAGTPDLM